MATNQELVERMVTLLGSGDLPAATRLLTESASDDFIQEWPQSGERFRKESLIRMGESYSAATGTRPTFEHHRTTGEGDLVVTEGFIDYGNGTTANYCGIAEFRDGKIAKLTEYFAAPFEAPEWRKQFVAQPVGARS
jgi:ketosteroid isomerase-like protein